MGCHYHGLEQEDRGVVTWRPAQYRVPVEARCPTAEGVQAFVAFLALQVDSKRASGQSGRLPSSPTIHRVRGEANASHLKPNGSMNSMGSHPVNAHYDREALFSLDVQWCSSANQRE